MWVEYDSLTISEPQCLQGLRLCLKAIVDHTQLNRAWICSVITLQY